MSEMKVVPGVAITPAMMVSNNVPPADYPVWSSATAYAIGTKVGLNNRNYEALVANTNRNPETDAVVPAAWLNLGPTNRWKMFNKRTGNTWNIGTFTSNNGSIDLTLRPGVRINSIGLVGVKASSVRIVMTVPGTATPVYDKAFPMSLKAGGSWYQYYFGQFVTQDNLAQFDLPPFNNADIRVIVSAPGGTAEVGMMVIGMDKTIGVAVYGTSLGRDNYSNVQEDDFGNITITPRGKRRSIDFNVVMKGDQVSSALRTLEPLSDTASLYVGTTELDYTIIVGFFERLAIGLPTFNHAVYSLEVRSLM